MDFDETFTRLDPRVWTDAYLPAWSSRAAAAAAYEVGADGLLLSIPPDHPLWCPDSHAPPLRVSAIHSANRSGPVGSTDAPQPFRDGLVVREQQPTVIGFAPHHGSVAVTCAAHLTARSMFSAWLVGLEDAPERCGEICVVEVFGTAVRAGDVALGQGIHRFRDPSLREDFSAEPTPLDVEQEHTYAVDWRSGRVTFSVDGVVTREADQAPDYPMMLILGLFDFPDEPGDPSDVPRLQVTRVTGNELGVGSIDGR
ncbi:glycoside hydrolase family 16 protein [Jatrophihabitans fulvus]